MWDRYLSFCVCARIIRVCASKIRQSSLHAQRARWKHQKYSESLVSVIDSLISLRSHRLFLRQLFVVIVNFYLYFHLVCKYYSSWSSSSRPSFSAFRPSFSSSRPYQATFPLPGSEQLRLRAAAAQLQRSTKVLLLLSKCSRTCAKGRRARPTERALAPRAKRS